MKIEIISVDEAIKRGNYKWEKRENEVDYLGHILDFCEGFCVEVIKKGEIGYMSMNAAGDVLNDDNSDFTDFYKEWMYDCGCEPTGVVVFRGYFDSYFDPDEREWYIKDASDKAIEFFEERKKWLHFVRG